MQQIVESCVDPRTGSVLDWSSNDKALSIPWSRSLGLCHLCADGERQHKQAIVCILLGSLRQDFKRTLYLGWRCSFALMVYKLLLSLILTVFFDGIVLLSL